MEEIVSRENEFRELQKCLEEMKKGRGNTVIVEGEHGIGKTFLCMKFGEYCKKNDVLFLDADARKYDMGRPYSTFNQILDALGSSQPTSIPLALSPFFSQNTLEPPDLRTAQGFLYEKVYRFFTTLCKEGLVLFFDNIEWMDCSSIGLLHYLATKARESKMLILCTYTPEDIQINQNERVKEMLSLMLSEKLCLRIKLGRLGREESLRIARMHLRQTPSRVVLEQIYEFSRGNPSLIKELCRIVNEEKRSELTGIEAVHLGVSFESRLERLEAKELEIAQIASIIGQSFEVELLAKMAEREEEEILEVLEKMESLELIEEQGDRFFFKTPVVRMLFYSRIPKEVRKHMHTKIADYIAKAMKEGAEKIYALAYHYFHGENYEMALRYLLRSVEMAYEEYGFERSLEFLRMAEKCALYLGNIFLLAEIKSKIGDIYYGLGEFEEAQKIYNSLVEETAVKNDAKLQSNLYLRLGNIANIRAEYWEALEYYEKAKEIARASKHEFEMAMGYRGAGYIYLRLGNWRKALDEYSLALGIANKLQNPWLNGILFLELGNLYNMRGNLEDALLHYSMASKNFEKGRYYLEMGRALCNAGEVYVQKEEFENANAKFTEALNFAKKTDNESFVQWVETNQGFVLVKFGKIEEAKKRCYAFIETCRLNRNRFGTARAFRVLGWAERELKNYENALEYFSLALEIHQSLGIPYELGRELWEIGRTYEAMGDTENAKKSYARAYEILNQIGANYYVKKLKSKLSG